MTPEQFFAGIAQLREEGLRLPHGFNPGAKPGGNDVFKDESSWNSYSWNPPGNFIGVPGFQDLAAFDHNASLKPTWAEIEVAAGVFNKNDTQQNVIRSLKEQCRERIIKCYDAESWEDEIQKRLGGRSTALQDAERDRLRRRHKVLNKWAADPARTLIELQGFDAFADVHWQEPGN